MILVLLIFLLLLFIGVPVGFSLGISGIFYFLQHMELPLATVVQLPISQTQSVTLLAVPLFIFAGSLMNSSGITTRLIKLAMQLAGHMRGGMAQVSVVLSTLMGGCSGSSNADAAMEARILGPEMLKQKYPRGYTAVVIGFTSLITSTIPPGVGMILYGTVGEVSIGRLFSAGIMSGLIMMAAFMITVAITARFRKFPKAREHRASIKEIVLSLKDTIWALIFPIVLIGSLRMGLFTPSEVGAFACVYALIVGFFVYKEMTIKSLIATLKEAIRDIGGIMFMISMSAVFAYGIPMDQIPQKLTTLITGFTNSQFVVMGIVFFLYVIFGMFMDGSIVILLLTPILMPIVRTIGIDPVLFGVVTSIIVTMGILTPPVGIAMYIVNGILGVPMSEYLKESIPFFIVTILVGVLLLAIPDVILFLPNMLYGVAS
ncbi:TRAP transporter large permease [Sphaerochaeta globosa]|uniref:TRAP dicarboxylate transporter, DctM subunit n=1 Tax=Sphaerochaeta globosa (strain ATCC BAA-1886 / DSM 22777 / Buddy) TaxID=158189 RepID=F0RWC0_SPHGB|nr:TRAP transporter large permease [Sphaerochaeta globosa]ADY13477.1 TRAP dicarboxylate transporter, DctM subunit [Sphaerochaeta globosa str. Buddy]